MRYIFSVILSLVLAVVVASPATARGGLPTHSQLAAALVQACAKEVNNGAIFSPCEMWASMVGLNGKVTVVVKGGGDPWRGSRVIAMQKANTAVLFSKNHGLALSTANLYSVVQDGGSLFGLQASNPVDTGAAYRGPAANYGTPRDPAVGRRVGGVNVFGGGLALYTRGGKFVGGLGVSGDSACADHVIVWRIRHYLHLDYLPAGVNKESYGGAIPPASGDDNIAYGAGGFSQHPYCGFGEKTVSDLPSVVSPKVSASK
ncbi:MAG: heme-binding protein [Candidatus Sungbacteria bacterium]|uniref:Heme-binding protein n=1 Tax=Candidatus Sungiibacteriota bacterium TaxID=2750080 RepID=A0A932QYH7_9BACT|nr:heme-binding protein [Candidatus Sungbacteria bacterium]